eukprot:TRINITY_DN3853_c0_g1_i1.p1 TRINITY_DN3853_c0_g1~~TRINITY_DN3853_c0_g1_i1.p1  ORF type:complete len:226 (+),score=47.38 TRINITY_DN3853_c0_g1_i1:161-838(+)
MYGLRCMNNLYKEHAGSRGDFIIVGHPEWQNGKVSKPSPLWDPSMPRCHPRNSPAAQRLRQSGEAALVKRLTQDLPGSPRPQRGLEKARSKNLSRSFSTPDMSGSQAFESFVERLTTAASGGEALPRIKNAGTPLIIGGGGTNDLGERGACRHYNSLSEELTGLADRLRREPERTRQLLEDSGSWKYWNHQLAVAEQHELRERHTHRLAKTKTLKVIARQSQKFT